MTRAIFLITVSLSLVWLSSCGEQAIDTKADLIITGGKVITVNDANPEAEAIAVAGDTILAVGSADEIDAYRTADTRIIELEAGQLVIPGFIESHAHFQGLGQSLHDLDLRQTRNWAEIVQLVKDAADRTPPGQWIVGRGWHQEKWDETPVPNVDGLPYHSDLSEISVRNPVLLTHASGHAVMANAEAMRLAGVTGETPDPEGGEIVRDPEGNPIGVFRETAEALIIAAQDQALEKQTPEEKRAVERERAMLAAQACTENGVTSFHDAGADWETIELYRELADSGLLDVRLYVMASGDQTDLERGMLEHQMIGAGNHFLTVRAIKVYMDGALGSHGAWLLEPYSDMPASTGLTVTPLDTIRQIADFAANHDFQLCTHAIGDRANRVTLDIYESAIGEIAFETDPRWRIEHAQHIAPADQQRFSEMGVIAAMQGVHCTSDGPWVPKRIGDKRAKEGAYVWQNLMADGAVVCNGTDAPVENVSPIECFYATVTRRLPDGSQFYPEQAMSRDEALRSYTINGAYAAFEDDIKGTLEPGKLADIVVLSADILTCPEEEITSAEPLYTIVGGEVLYEK